MTSEEKSSEGIRKNLIEQENEFEKQQRKFIDSFKQCHTQLACTYALYGSRHNKHSGAIWMNDLVASVKTPSKLFCF